MVIMAGGIARGRVRTTKELPNIVTTLQIIRWRRHAAALVYFFDIEHPYYDQLTPKQNKVSANQYQVIKLSLAFRFV